MRTTIVIDDSLNGKLKALASKRELSHFINECLKEYLETRERKERLHKLEKSYARASQKKQDTDFDSTVLEEWPEW